MFDTHSKFTQALFSLCGAVLAFAVPALCLAQGATPTQTTLSITPGTSVPVGTPVTLSANVTANGSSLHDGIVFFCKADAAHCEDSSLLGSAPLQSGGSAKLLLRMGVGPHNIRAAFQGTPNSATPRMASTSDPQTLTVTGKVDTITTSTTTEFANGVYKLTSRVLAFGRPSISGDLSFTDSLNGSGPMSLGSTLLSPTNTVFGLIASAPTQLGNTRINGLTAGDFNRDGIPDLIANLDSYPQSALSILLGKGDGTFNPPSPLPLDNNVPDQVVVADFNADGVDDLAVTCGVAGKVAIILGRPDGTFAPATYFPALNVRSIVVADFNGDGKLDIVISASSPSGTGNSTVSTFLGNGDGTFAVPLNLSIGDGILGLWIGNFNSDNVPDLAMRTYNATSDGISILLGTGNGSFSVGPAPNTDLVSQIAVADFNGDGFTDLATITSQYPLPTDTVSVYIANGDGTFNLKSTPIIANRATEPDPIMLKVADFNGDGFEDVAVELFQPETSQSTVRVLLGAGNGTFPRSTTTVQADLLSALPTDFNSDGIPDLISRKFNNQLSTTRLVVLSGIQITTGAIRNVTLSDPGSHSINATFSGSDVLAPSIGPPVTVNVP